MEKKFLRLWSYHSNWKLVEGITIRAGHRTCNPENEKPDPATSPNFWVLNCFAEKVKGFEISVPTGNALAACEFEIFGRPDDECQCVGGKAAKGVRCVMGARYECVACDGGAGFDLFDGFCYENSEKFIQHIIWKLYVPAGCVGIVVLL